MKKDPGLAFRLCVMFGDAFAIVASFSFAYFIRTHLDSRPYYFDAEPLDFALTALLLIPVWWIVLALLGCYSKTVFLARSRAIELLRLMAASVIGVMTIITFDFFYRGNLFPVRPVAAWATVLCFFSLAVFRAILRRIRYRVIVKRGAGTTDVIIVGDDNNTEHLIEFFNAFPEEGYRIKAIVASNKFIPEKFRNYKYASLKDALEKVQADVIFHTDSQKTEYIYNQAIKYHLMYYFVPKGSAIASHIGQLELIGDTPAIEVRITPLIGGARFIKRSADIVLSSMALIIAAIPMSIVWLIVKISDPHHSPIYASERLSLHNQKVKIYKFRSMKPEFSGMSPEEAFTKMGKSDIIEEYRNNGDFLTHDPRITKIGHFLRSTSIDELPQLWNVLKGDISLVGPRALVPGELRDYGDRSLLLSVKSGLTGLAQVSGRRDISFDERRALDIYYVQNWSLLLDFQIILRTVGAIFTHKGAK